MQVLQFDYFRGMEAEQYSFYRVPKTLFTEECFRSLSCEAKVLYGLMLDRMSLSMKNQWFDEENKVYIIFTVEETMELLGCGRQKAIKSIAELDTEKGIGLIEKKRLGLGKPNVIYVKNFMIRDCPGQEEKREIRRNAGGQGGQAPGSGEGEFQEVSGSYFQKYENQTSGSMKNGLPEVRKSDFQKYENQTSGSMEKGFQEVPKSKPNKTNIIKTDYNETEFSETDIDRKKAIPSNLFLAKAHAALAGYDAIRQMDDYRQVIRKNIDYEYHAREEVDELVELMVEVMVLPDDSVVRVAGTDKPAAVVKNRFMKLDFSHIEYVLSALHGNTTKVGNIKAYLLTTLYNAPLTINNYYNAEVNHDLYGGG